jgi:hypothetical protein
MAAAANDEAPILVRNDPIMYRFLQNQKDKFKITIDITSNSSNSVIAKYEICLFMYDMKSRERKDCPSLKDDYHSHKKGQGCSYVGFINKELTDDVHNAFFYKYNTTTWFLDYNIIDPTIKIEEITEENYLTPFIMNKNAENQIKKISYAEGNLISHVKSIFGEDEVIKTFKGTLAGEHVVISNGDKPIFTLSELFFNYDYTEKHNILSRVLNKFLIIALLNNENKFTYKNGPNEKMTIHDFYIEVNSVDYINGPTEQYLTYSENINECIKNILTCLKNNSVDAYVSTHSLPETEEWRKNFNKMSKKISTIQEELFSIFKYRLPFDSNKKLIEARELVNRGYIPSDKTIFTEVSQILNDKKQAYLKKIEDLDKSFQELLELAETISDTQLITETNKRQELAETATKSVLNKFDKEIKEQESLNAKIIENQEQITRKRNEEQARRTEEEARLKQEYEQMSPDNKKKKKEESMRKLIELRLLKPSKTQEEKEMIQRKRKEEENHEKMQSQLRQELLKREKEKAEKKKEEAEKEKTFSAARESLISIQEINTMTKILDVFNDIIFNMEQEQKSIPIDNKEKLDKMEIFLKNIKTYLDNMKKHFIKDKSFQNLKDYLLNNIIIYFKGKEKIIKYFESNFNQIFMRHHANVLADRRNQLKASSKIRSSNNNRQLSASKKGKHSGGSKKKKLTRKMKK